MRLSRWQDCIGEKQTVLSLAKVTGLEVGMTQSEAMLAPLFDLLNLVRLLVLKQIALRQEVVGPKFIATHLTHLREQRQCFDITALQFCLVQASINVKSECFGLELHCVLLTCVLADRLNVVAHVIVIEARVWKLEIHFFGTLGDKVVDLLGFEKVADG